MQGRNGSLSPLVKGLLTLFAAVMLLSVPVARADEQEHFLDYSEYNFAVNFVSGNLTATVTPATVAPRDWPRVIFQHNTDMLSPIFDVGIPTIFLFNDSNGDGFFSRSEITYIAYLSSLYNVTWNATAVEFGNDVASGEYAWLRANAVIGLFADAEDEYPIIDEWANVTFTFRISEKNATKDNTFGYYMVRGKVDIQISFELLVLEHVNATGIVLEQVLSAGGSTSMFLIREDVGLSSPQLTSADGRNDETIFGDNFTNPLRKTSLPCQDILFSKEDQTVQAHYGMSSEPYMRRDQGIFQVPMAISYYTTGDGLVAHTAYSPADQNGTLSHEMIVGIDESGFTPRFRDWVRDNLAMIMIVTGSIAAVISISVLVLMLRRHRGWGRKGSEADAPDKKA